MTWPVTMSFIGLNVEYISTKHVYNGYLYVTIYVWRKKLYGNTNCVGITSCITHRPVETSQPKLIEIFHRTFYMDVHMPKIHLLLAILDIIIKCSQKSYTAVIIITLCYTVVSCWQVDNGCRKSVTNVVW